MAYTVEIIVTPGSGNVTASPRLGGTGTAAAGYPITQVAGNLHTITIADELLGPWALTAGDGNSMRLVTFKSDKDEYLLSEDIPDAVLAAAVDNPIRADMRLIDGEPPQPLGYDPAKESSVQNILTAVNGLDGPGAPTGPGGITVVIPVTSNNQPVDGAAVWITTDPEGTNQIAGVIHTDTFGNTNPAFTLEAGIFYVWVQKAGINFPNPQAIEVLENGTYQWHTG